MGMSPQNFTVPITFKCNKFKYKSGMVNSKSFVSKDFFEISGNTN